LSSGRSGPRSRRRCSPLRDASLRTRSTSPTGSTTPSQWPPFRPCTWRYRRPFRQRQRPSQVRFRHRSEDQRQHQWPHREPLLAEEEAEQLDGLPPDEGGTRGYESILDALQPLLPWRQLGWHYRSKDERLIAFSNAHIYGGSLTTFPGAFTEAPISHVLVGADSARPTAKGSSRWLNLGSAGGQPSELAKVAVILVAARIDVQLPWSVYRRRFAIEHLTIDLGIVNIVRDQNNVVNLPPSSTAPTPEKAREFDIRSPHRHGLDVTDEGDEESNGARGLGAQDIEDQDGYYDDSSSSAADLPQMSIISDLSDSTQVAYA